MCSLVFLGISRAESMQGMQCTAFFCNSGHRTEFGLNGKTPSVEVHGVAAAWPLLYYFVMIKTLKPLLQKFVPEFQLKWLRLELPQLLPLPYPRT